MDELRKCPFCLTEIPIQAKVCKQCNSTVVKRCPLCAEEIVATAKKCRFCGGNVETPGAAAPAAKTLRSDVPCGERREIVLTLLLLFLTCGIYGIVLQYKIGDELNRHQGKNQINPGMDLLLTFLTCGLWIFYVMVKYPRALQEITTEEGVTPVDLVVPSILLTIFGFHPVALLILQSELNKHWDAHLPARS